MTTKKPTKKKTPVVETEVIPAGPKPRLVPLDMAKKVNLFLDKVKIYREVKDIYTYRDGTTKSTVRFVGADMIFVHKIAREVLKCGKTQLYELAENCQELANSLKRVKEVQTELLVTNALLGSYNATFAIFSAKNMLGWRDVKDYKVMKFNAIGIFLQKLEEERSGGREVFIGTEEKPVTPKRIHEMKQELGIEAKTS